MLYKIKNAGIKASEIANFLGKELIGKDVLIKYVCTIDNIKENSVFFVKGQNFVKGQKKINNARNTLAITAEIAGLNESNFESAICSKNPRLDFIKVMRKFFVELIREGINKSAVIDAKAKIGKNVSIGQNSYIGAEAEIGNNTIIRKNVVIGSKVKIGEDCVIKDNTVIGSEGFGFEYDENDVPIHFPQIGSVVIGNNVWIGSNSIIERATFEKTIIGNNVMIEDVVQVGHNCIIGDNTFISGGVIICGSVNIGKNCWLAPNSVIRECITIGDKGFVGLGAVVVKDVPANETVVGNPARKFERKSD